MTLKKQPLQLPIADDGTVMHYDYGRGKYKDNFVFLSTLHYKGYSRGRSSALIQLADSQGAVYNLFMSSFDELMKMTNRHQYSFTHGAVFTGRWTYCKKGQNFALRPLTDQEDEDYNDLVTKTNQAAFAAASQGHTLKEPWNIRTDSDRE